MKTYTITPRTNAKLTVLIVGNCQGPVLATLLESMAPGLEAVAIELLPDRVTQLLSGKMELGKLIERSSFVLLGGRRERIERSLIERYSGLAAKIRRYPNVEFAAFHPDVDYVEYQRKQITGPMLYYHSALVLWGWKNGCSVKETAGLFRREVFQHLNYFEYLAPAKTFLLEEGVRANVPLRRLLAKWLSNGCFMHSMNHPKLFVLADIARELLARENVEFEPDVERYIPDPLAARSCWPVYPEIADVLGVPGNYYFKPHNNTFAKMANLRLVGLDEIIEDSYRAYSSYGRDDLVCRRLDSPRYQSLRKFVNATTLGAKRGGSTAIPRRADGPEASSRGSRSAHPYKDLPNYQYWNRAFDGRAMDEVDPVIKSRFGIKREDKIATAGSCFAQHISKTLKNQGYNYFVAKEGEYLQENSPILSNTGVFSARYGNIYTACQLVQLIDRAYGRYMPYEMSWTRVDGAFIDPFRPQIEANGFRSLGELTKSREDHFAAVRDMFERLDVFIFTLGLTEAWRLAADGSVFPLAPGVSGGEMDFSKYEFVNFTTECIAADLQNFIDRLHKVNSGARVIFTVSPVPLIATYEGRHVLVSTTYSKSALRVAADTVVRKNTNCDYFPSYEIVTGAFTRGGYFENDLRNVNALGVEHVMRLFKKHYLLENDSAESLALNQELLSEAARISEIICDEEALDAK